MSIQNDFFKLRQKAEQQAFIEFDDRYASSYPPAAAYRDMLGLVAQQDGALSVRQGLDTGWIFREDLADVNHDGQISAGEQKKLENYSREELIKAALVMDRVNELIANPSQLTDTPVRMPAEQQNERRNAIGERRTEIEIREYIALGSQTSFVGFAKAEQEKITAATAQAQAEAQARQPVVTKRDDGGMNVTYTDGTTKSFTQEQLSTMQTPPTLVGQPVINRTVVATLNAAAVDDRIMADGHELPKSDTIFAATETPAPASPSVVESPKSADDLIAYTGTNLQGDKGKTFTGVLFKGIHNVDAKFAGENGLVAQLQRDLKELKLYEGEIDGKFGPRTEAAIKKFQHDNGLEDSGIVGKETIAAIQIQQLANLAAKENSPTDAVQKESIEAYAALGNYAGIVPDSLKNMMAKVGLEHNADATVRLASVPNTQPTGRATVPD